MSLERWRGTLAYAIIVVAFSASLAVTLYQSHQQDEKICAVLEDRRSVLEDLIVAATRPTGEGVARSPRAEAFRREALARLDASGPLGGECP